MRFGPIKGLPRSATVNFTFQHNKLAQPYFRFTTIKTVNMKMRWIVVIKVHGDQAILQTGDNGHVKSLPPEPLWRKSPE